MSEETYEICPVCGEPLDEYNVSRCMICGCRFHMQWSRDAAVTNCGQVYADPISSGIGFICNQCVEQHPEVGGSIIQTEEPPP